MSKATELILTKSIEDIRAGEWCQATLSKVEVEYENPLTSTRVVDSLFEHEVEDMRHMEGYKPLGQQLACAVGLLSMYGDKGLETLTLTFDGEEYTFITNLRTPTADSPKPIRDAVEALFLTIPRDARRSILRKLDGESGLAFSNFEEIKDFEHKVTAVIMYNDMENPPTTQRKALNWFTRALEYVQAQNQIAAEKRRTKTTTKENLKTALKGA